eukprot:TRINITY_DN403_c0_g1_i1.p1 TRINITY_DN403_c0_g1~~TRINITY_DN403_c0_g1_i1.p1  ORF type:complete len:263 (+),score=79.64 TRINITY_DN403_c0_g1_i1:83-871(+)
MADAAPKEHAKEHAKDHHKKHLDGGDLGISQDIDALPEDAVKKDSQLFKLLLENNKDFVAKTIAADPNFFKGLAQPQHPSYLVISCSDSRLELTEATEMHPGSIFSHRNVGNQVLPTDFNVQSVIQYAVEYLKVKHILIVGHTDCGAVKASCNHKYYGLIDHWLTPLRDIAEKHKTELQQIQKTHPENHLRVLTETIIKEQVLNVCKSPAVQKAWDQGEELFVHGCIFEIETGTLKDLAIPHKAWSNVKPLYKINFHETGGH